MIFRLKILGANSAAPAFNRNQTSQLFQAGNSYFLIDCGEGTQMRLMKSGVKISKIDYILISHLHGDHFFGLVGLLSTMHLFGRTKPLNIYCPSHLKEIIEIQLKYSDTHLNFETHYFFTDTSEQDVLIDNKEVTISKFQLDHSIFCTGFLIREKEKKRKILRDKTPRDLPVKDYSLLKEGKDILDEKGNLLYRNAELTAPSDPPKSYAFCSDTRYTETIISSIKGVDLLYHEATFGAEMTERAHDTFHSTAAQAATIAVKAQVKKLLIGHYSVRYRELDVLLNEARSIFPETDLAIEGSTYDI